MAEPKKKGLGKGLGALLGPGSSEPEKPAAAPEAAPAPLPAAPATLSDGSRLIELDPTTINPSPKQPRRFFDEDALAELSESIRRDGIQEPVIVRPAGDGYELVCGERRVKASIMADLLLIPAVVRDVPDRDMLKFGLIENIQRENLNAIETALAYEELLQEYNWTQEQLADEVGKKRATVTNTLRLLNLPQLVQDMVADGSLSMGHARALLSIDNPAKLADAARKVIAEGLSVRQTEQLASGQPPKPAPPRAPEKDPNIARLEDELRRSLGTKVYLRSKKGGSGKIEIDYYNLDELDRILEVLRRTRG